MCENRKGYERMKFSGRSCSVVNDVFMEMREKKQHHKNEGFGFESKKIDRFSFFSSFQSIFLKWDDEDELEF